MHVIQWTDEAKKDLLALIAFIAEENPGAAPALLQRFQSALLHAAQHPFLFRPGRVAATREIVAHPHYIIVYQIENEVIKVLSILHARREYP